MRVQIKTMDRKTILFDMHLWDMVHLLIYQGLMRIEGTEDFELFADGKKVPKPTYPEQQRQ